ncbi:MAG: hypothetical protein KJO52_13800, partial [Maribacter sp.]|nr:hypothetical protein [Maribacter sp.]
YKAIAEKYKSNPKAMGYLQKKIVEGGTGVWGEVMMPAHPNVTQEESRQITQYIQSLVQTGSESISLPPSGSIIPEPSEGDNVMVITASYTDNGETNAPALTGVGSVALQGSTVPFTPTTKNKGFMPVSLRDPIYCWHQKMEGGSSLRTLIYMASKQPILPRVGRIRQKQGSILKCD